MKIEIYGVPEEFVQCPGCKAAVDFCRSYGLEFTFIPVLIKDSSSIGFTYHRANIEECRLRAGKDTPPRSYPQIFVNDKWVGAYKTFSEKFEGGCLD
ncbi:glutaredoxin [Aeromonas phage AsFcp_4]|nr:glutaredoxin [Aeromonas phage AsFcp_4]